MFYLEAFIFFPYNITFYSQLKKIALFQINTIKITFFFCKSCNIAVRILPGYTCKKWTVVWKIIHHSKDMETLLDSTETGK